MKKAIMIIAIFLSFNLLATELTDKRSVPSIGTIHSLELENHQSISIYLPDNYESSKEKFPVMYVLDGDRYFLHSIAYQKTLTWKVESPNFIVIGINIDKNKRRELLGRQSNEYIDIFQHQIVDYVEKNYRTNNKRMYFGWEMAGGFALDLFAKQPELIDAYFLASSTHFTQKRIDNVEKILKSKITMPNFFYYTLGSVETWSLESHKKLSKVFSNTSKEDDEWEFYLSSSDNHYTTPLNTINKGLTNYFNDYAPIRFYSIKEFKSFGGIKALTEHYKKRGEHYQISTNIHSETKHYLLNQAINEDNFSFFSKLISQFDGFIESNNYSTGFIMKIGKFYSNNGATEKAMRLYKSELTKNPTSQRVSDELLKISKKHQ